MPLLQTWEILTCPACPSTTFVPLVTLKAKVGGGSTSEPAGYQCSVCHHKADLVKMQQTVYLKQKREEMAALEAEISQAS